MARGSRLISLNPASATCVSSPEHPTRQHSAVSRASHCYPILRPSKRGAGFTTPGYPVVKPVLNLFLTCFSETKVKSLLSRTLLQVKANPESCFLKSCKFQQCGEGERQLRPPPENRLCPQSPPVSAARALEGEPTHTPQRGLLEPSVRDQDVPGTLPRGQAPPTCSGPEPGSLADRTAATFRHWLAQVEQKRRQARDSVLKRQRRWRKNLLNHRANRHSQQL